jgi:hypothetical protein
MHFERLLILLELIVFKAFLLFTFYFLLFTFNYYCFTNLIKLVLSPFITPNT